MNDFIKKLEVATGRTSEEAIIKTIKKKMKERKDSKSAFEKKQEAVSIKVSNIIGVPKDWKTYNFEFSGNSQKFTWYRYSANDRAACALYFNSKLKKLYAVVHIYLYKKLYNAKNSDDLAKLEDGPKPSPSSPEAEKFFKSRFDWPVAFAEASDAEDLKEKIKVEVKKYITHLKKAKGEVDSRAIEREVAKTIADLSSFT